MSTTYHPIAPITHQRDVFPQAISALSFDPVSDSIWAGLHSGHVVAFHTAQGLRGVSFPVGGSLPVKKIVPGDTYVRALGVAGEGVGQWSKGGVNKWNHRYDATRVCLSRVIH